MSDQPLSISDSEDAEFQVGDRVEANWDLRSGRDRFYPGFVSGVAKNGNVKVTRDEDLETKEFTKKHLRRLALDAAGYVSAAGLGYQGPVRAWVAAGRDVDVIVDGFTALYLACEEGQTAVARYLVEEAGARPEVPNAFGVRCWDLAFMAGRPGTMGYAARVGLAERLGLGRAEAADARVARPAAAEAFRAAAGAAWPGGAVARPWVLRAADLQEHEGGGLPSHALCVEHGWLHPFPPPPENGRPEKWPGLLYVSLGDEGGEGGGGGGGPLGGGPRGVGAGGAAEDRSGRLAAACAFLERHPEIEYVFCPQSCLPAPPRRNYHGSSREVERLLASASAAFYCSHWLMIPYIEMIKIKSTKTETVQKGFFKTASSQSMTEQEKTYIMSNVPGYFDTAYCMWEYTVALFAGCSMFCSFYLEEKIDDFIKLPSIFSYTMAIQEQDRALPDAMQAFLEARLGGVGGGAGAAAAAGLARAVALGVLRDSADPIALVSQCAYAVMSLKDDAAAARRVAGVRLGARALARQPVGLAAGEGTLADVAALLGRPPHPLSRGPLLNALLLVLLHAMGRLGADQPLAAAAPAVAARPAAAAAPARPAAPAAAAARPPARPPHPRASPPAAAPHRRASSKDAGGIGALMAAQYRSPPRAPRTLSYGDSPPPTAPASRGPRKVKPPPPPPPVPPTGGVSTSPGCRCPGPPPDRGMKEEETPDNKKATALATNHAERFRDQSDAESGLDIELFRLDALCSTVNDVMNETLAALDKGKQDTPMRQRDHTPARSRASSRAMSSRHPSSVFMPISLEAVTIQPNQPDASSIPGGDAAGGPRRRRPSSPASEEDEGASSVLMAVCLGEEGGGCGPAARGVLCCRFGTAARRRRRGEWRRGAKKEGDEVEDETHDDSIEEEEKGCAQM